MTDSHIIVIDNLKLHRYIMPGIESNMYLLTEGDSALIIDPNVNLHALSLMRECGVRNAVVLLTHEHCDHISGVNWLRENFPVEVFASEAGEEALREPSGNLSKYWRVLLMDKPPEKAEAALAVADHNYTCFADRAFADRTDFLWNDHQICMQAAPGHSPGGALIFLDGHILFSGDNLVNGSGVICRLPGGNWKTYNEKTRPVIEGLADDTWVLPGHGEPAKLSGVRKYLNKFGSV